MDNKERMDNKEVSINWEQRRYELVRAIVAGKLAGKVDYDVTISDAVANRIIGTANRIIEKLKKANENQPI